MSKIQELNIFSIIVLSMSTATPPLTPCIQHPTRVLTAKTGTPDSRLLQRLQWPPRRISPGPSLNLHGPSVTNKHRTSVHMLDGLDAPGVILQGASKEEGTRMIHSQELHLSPKSRASRDAHGACRNLKTRHDEVKREH